MPCAVANLRNSRILVFDIAAGRCTAEYVYCMERSNEFDPMAKPAAQRACAITAVNPTRLLVLERTNRISKVYAIELKGATNVLDRTAESPDLEPLELLDDLPGSGIHAVSKSLLVDLSQLADVPPKIEGLAIVGDREIAVSNDDDFGIEHAKLRPASSRMKADPRRRLPVRR